MHNNAPSPRLRRLPRISLRSLAAATLISSAIVIAAPSAGSATNTPERHPQGEPACQGVVAVEDSYFTPFETQLVVGGTGVLINDTVPCPGLLVQFGAASAGALVGNPATGSFVYNPPPGFTGEATAVYAILDGATPVASATITIFVAPPPCEQVLNDDAYATPFDTPLNVAAPGVGVNDTACGEPFQLVSSTSSGTLVFNADGTFSYTPNAGFIGVDQFVYAVDAPEPPGFRRRIFAGFRSPAGIAPDTAVVTITIEGPPATTTTTTDPGTPTTTPPPTTVPAPTTTVVTSNTLPATR